MTDWDKRKADYIAEVEKECESFGEIFPKWFVALWRWLRMRDVPWDNAGMKRHQYACIAIIVLGVLTILLQQ